MPSINVFSPVIGQGTVVHTHDDDDIRLVHEYNIDNNNK